MKRSGRGVWLSRAAAAAAVLLAVGLLTRSQAVGQGVRRGLEICGSVLIPSLFPFMVLSGLLSSTGLGKTISRPLAPLTEKVFKLPRELGAVVLLSLIGGYPVGAKSIAGLLEERRISRATAQRMLCFCVNSGPSFLISAVGAGMFLRQSAGVVLFVTQTAATVLIGVAVSWRARREEPLQTARPMSGAEALVAAVTGAANAMIAMCAFAVLFMGILSLLDSVGVSGIIARALPVSPELVQVGISGLLEVTAGCLGAAEIGGMGGFAIASVFVSFSGLSVLCQIMSCFRGMGVDFRPLLRARLAHAVLATAMALPLYQIFCGEVQTALVRQAPVLVGGRKTWISSLCLLGMCTVLLLSVRLPKKVERKRKCGNRKGAVVE